MAVHKRVARARGTYICEVGGPGLYGIAGDRMVIVEEVERHEIVPGDPYEWYRRARFDSKQIRCAEHRWTPRELRTYGTGKTEALRQSADSISDDIEDRSYETPEELEEVMAALAEEARAAAEEYEANVDSMESGGFSETEQMSTMRETASTLESWADELEGWTAPEQTYDEGEGYESGESKINEDWYEEIDAEVLASVPGYGG